MKKIILSIFSLLTFGIFTSAQVGIETDTRPGTILDFPKENVDRGILLPRVENTTNAGTTPGTFVYDKTSKKVLIYGYDKSTNTSKWIELTTTPNNTPISDNLNPVNLTESAKGVTITDKTSMNNIPEGVLTLESDNKALALPAVDNVANLPSPKAGLICYDKASKSLAIFNGEVWYFWN